MPNRHPSVAGYRLWVQKVIWLASWLFLRLVRTDMQGNIPAGPCIIVSNHLHYIDIPLAGRFVIRYGERAHWLAKTELFPVPVLGSVLRGMQSVEVHRGAPDRRALEQVIGYAQLDKVWVFPEGHRSPDRRLLPGKEGVVLIARRAGCPLLPVAIAGTEGGVGPLLRRRAVFRLRVGEPFLLPPGLPRRQALEYVMQRIAELLPEEYRPPQTGGESWSGQSS